VWERDETILCVDVITVVVFFKGKKKNFIKDYHAQNVQETNLKYANSPPDYLTKIKK